MNYIDSRVTGVNSINSVIEDVETLKTSKQDTLPTASEAGMVLTATNTTGGITWSMDGGSGQLLSDLTATVAVGGIPVGKTYSKGTSLDTVIRDMLAPAKEYKMYWGMNLNIPTAIDDTFTEETCPSTLKTNGAIHYFTYTAQTENGPHLIYAYPALYGNLAHIYCNDLTQFDLIGDWTKTTVTYNELEYNMYYSTLGLKPNNDKFQYLFVLE